MVYGFTPPPYAPTLPSDTPVAFDGFLEWQVYSQSVVDLDISAVLEAGTQTDLPPAVEGAYDAPFPDPVFKAGARALPALAFSEPDQNAAAWAVLERWPKPFVLIWAPEDPILGSGYREFLRRVPGTAGQPHRAIPGADHFLFEDKPDEVLAALLGFLEP